MGPKQSSPSTVSTPASSTVAVFSPKVFSSSIADKLSEENYPPWRHEALASIKGYKLQSHFNSEKVPAGFNTIEMKPMKKNRSVSQLGAAGSSPCIMDSVINGFFLQNRMVGCELGHQIWSKIETYFASQTRSKIKQLKTQLKIIKKQGLASDYLLKIKKVVDSLVAFGAPLTVNEHIEVILEGLPKEYSAFITMTMSRTDSFSVDELEALFMAQEEMTEKFKKVDLGLVQANMAQSDARTVNNAQGFARGSGRHGRGRGFRGGGL